MSLKVGYTAVAWLVQTISREEGVGADAVGWRAQRTCCAGRYRLMEMTSIADGICMWCQVDVEMIHRID